MKLSVCIPTYNRAKYLANCLQSIIFNNINNNIDCEVCVSDNCSTDNTEDVVLNAQNSINIKYHKNKKNEGRVKNYLNVVNMAEGEYVWLLGDDDLLLPHALTKIVSLIKENKDVDFFYVNSFNLSTEYVLSFPQPFNIRNLPVKLAPFSCPSEEGKRSFISLVNPKISSDFMGAMFLAVFRKNNWIRNTDALNVDAIMDNRTFSHFDNTFPHLKIFTRAFANSEAYFFPSPLTVNLSGAREWSPMSPLINIVRLIEALNEYRKNGLPWFQYYKCKNFALRTFWPDYIRLILNRKESGYEYINPITLLLNSLLFPYSYLSPLYYFFQKIKKKDVVILPNKSSSDDCEQRIK